MGGLQIFIDMAQLFHTDQSRRHSRGRTDELESALAIGLETNEGVANNLRKIPGELALQHRGTAYDGDAERLRRFKRSEFFPAQGLIGRRKRLAHAEIERHLNDFEMVLFSAGLCRQADHIGQ